MDFEWDSDKADSNVRKHGVSFVEAATKMAEKDEVREEYRRDDLGTGTRGKFYAAYEKGTNIVLLDPDVAKAFPDSKSVNQALREYLEQRGQDLDSPPGMWFEVAPPPGSQLMLIRVPSGHPCEISLSIPGE